MASPADRLQQLEQIEKEISNALQAAGQGLNEMSKERPGIKHIENHTNTFLKSLEKVEAGLSAKIQYLTQVSTGQPHEGSSYAAQKDLQMAFHRLEHVRSRLQELEKMKIDHGRGPSSHPTQPVGQVSHPTQPSSGGGTGGGILDRLVRTPAATEREAMQRSYSQPPGDHMTPGMPRTFSADPPGHPH